MKKLKNYTPFILSTFILLAIDLASKYFILYADFKEIKVIGNFLKIVIHKNSGVAFGIFLGYWVQLLISTAIVIFLTYFCFACLSEKNRFYSRILLGIIIGGAIGNLINRIHLGYVIDFISIWKFPIINIADIGITLGLIILLALNWNVRTDQ